MSDAKPILVWSEVPVTDLDRAITYYNAVFDWDLKIDTTGPNPLAFFGNDMETIGGHLYPGKPATDNGPTVHLAVPDTLEATVDRVWKAGGEVLGEAIEIPFGRFIYTKDPDGNSVGLFEAKAA